MLSNLTDVMRPALKGGYAVACFNVFGYEDARAVVDAAEARKASVILAVNLDMTEFMPLQHITGMLRPLAESASVPVCLHLDHNYEIDTVKQAIDYGFSSVMYDGSQKLIADNIAGIQTVVEYARKQGVSVEAEVGSVPYAKGRDHIKSAPTSVAEAIAMVEQGQPDALAISIGNVHRIEDCYVDIDFDNFDALEQAVDIPLVIHGTSGIKAEDIRSLARRNVCKFNIGTCLRQRFGSALRHTLSSDEKLFDRLTIMKKVMPELSDEASQMIELLGQ
jgi:fructose-bisphosphate aldolase class II